MIMRELLRLEDVPAYQNKMFCSAFAARACPRGDIVLVQNEATGLIANSAYAPDILKYDNSYQNEQGHSSVFRAHLSEVLAITGRHFRSKRILEIGCGKGAFLDLLRQDGHDAQGIDPAYEGSQPHILKAAFEPSLGLRSEAVIMRHVLEHIPEPLTFLKSVREANGDQGMIYIEVPCFDWILRKRAWFDVFYEHVNYFRLSDFHRIFAHVFESGYLFSGQYLYAIADLQSLRDPPYPKDSTAVRVPQDFLASVQSSLKASTASQRVIWGGAAKGVMFAYHALRRGVTLDFAIDINPAKQGKYLAGSALPLLSPESGLAQLQPDSDIFVMNSNYLSEIQAVAGPRYNYIAADAT